MACERCPCPDICLGWATFCAWAAECPSDETKLLHICKRSHMGATPTVPADVQAKARQGIATAIMVRQCQFRSTEGCGCSGARCALRGGATVNHLDCFACVETYG